MGSQFLSNHLLEYPILEATLKLKPRLVFLGNPDTAGLLNDIFGIGKQGCMQNDVAANMYNI